MRIIYAESGRDRVEKRVGTAFVEVTVYPNEIHATIDHDDDREETYTIKRVSDIMCPIFSKADKEWLTYKLAKYGIIIK